MCLRKSVGVSQWEDFALQGEEGHLIFKLAFRNEHWFGTYLFVFCVVHEWYELHAAMYSPMEPLL
jgi:hypothetical protein